MHCWSDQLLCRSVHHLPCKTLLCSSTANTSGRDKNVKLWFLSSNSRQISSRTRGFENPTPHREVSIYRHTLRISTASNTECCCDFPRTRGGLEGALAVSECTPPGGQIQESRYSCLSAEKVTRGGGGGGLAITGEIKATYYGYGNDNERECKHTPARGNVTKNTKILPQGGIQEPPRGS